MIGVGGGIVIVPILYHVLATLGVDPGVRMQIAVGTSLAAIVSAALSSGAEESGKGDIDWGQLRRWAIPMLAGVLIGGVAASFASGGALSLVFAIAAIPIALLLAFAKEDRRIADHLPQGAAGWTLPAFIGGISVMMGVSEADRRRARHDLVWRRTRRRAVRDSLGPAASSSPFPARSPPSSRAGMCMACRPTRSVM